MSLLGRIWRKIIHPTGFVGRDLQGNSFYEKPSSLAAHGRPKRSVKYRHPEDMWDYIGGSKKLPIQWSAWLAHTRPHPPTIQELQTDFIRQQRVQHNAALIEASFQQEREQLRLQEAEAASGSSSLLPPPNESVLTAYPHAPSSAPAPELTSSSSTSPSFLSASPSTAPPASHTEPEFKSEYAPQPKPKPQPDSNAHPQRQKSAPAQIPETPTAPTSRSDDPAPLPKTSSDDYQPESWNPNSISNARKRVKRGQSA